MAFISSQSNDNFRTLARLSNRETWLEASVEMERLMKTKSRLFPIVCGQLDRFYQISWYHIYRMKWCLTRVDDRVKDGAGVVVLLMVVDLVDVVAEKWKISSTFGQLLNYRISLDKKSNVWLGAVQSVTHSQLSQSRTLPGMWSAWRTCNVFMKKNNIYFDEGTLAAAVLKLKKSVNKKNGVRLVTLSSITSMRNIPLACWGMPSSRLPYSTGTSSSHRWSRRCWTSASVFIWLF